MSPHFFFNNAATSEIYTLSLHDALPISRSRQRAGPGRARSARGPAVEWSWLVLRSEEHTSELQSQFHLVCRLLLEKKKNPQHISPGPRTQQLFDSCNPLRALVRPGQEWH